MKKLSPYNDVVTLIQNPYIFQQPGQRFGVKSKSISLVCYLSDFHTFRIANLANFVSSAIDSFRNSQCLVLLSLALLPGT